MNVDSSLVEEVRARAMEISARYDHDLDKYFDHLLEYQEKHHDRLVDQRTVVKSKRVKREE